jgi:hypothetical protein
VDRVGVSGIESLLVKEKLISAGAITGCAAGIYGPVLVSGIKSVLE